MRKLFNSESRLTQGFGARPAYYAQFGLKGHEGLDLVPTGKDWTVLCLEDGVVVKDDDIAGEKRTDAYGINVTVWHPKLSKATQYCHLSENYVFLNQAVKAGEKIGKMGSSGNTDGAHVHLNLFRTDIEGYRKNKDNGYLGGIDPVPFLEEDSAIITQPIAQQGQITDQTKIPQLDNKEVQQIKSEIEAKNRKIADDGITITRAIKDAQEAVSDAQEIKRQYDLLNADFKSHMVLYHSSDNNVEIVTTTFPVDPKTTPKTAEPVFSGLLVNLLQYFRKYWH